MLSSKGHAVAIPQDMNISRSLPKLPEEVGIVVLRRKGSNQTTKHYFVKRSAVDNALKGIGIDFQMPTISVIFTNQAKAQIFHAVLSFVFL